MSSSRVVRKPYRADLSATRLEVSDVNSIFLLASVPNSHIPNLLRCYHIPSIGKYGGIGFYNPTDVELIKAMVSRSLTPEMLAVREKALQQTSPIMSTLNIGTFCPEAPKLHQ